jgi:spermidine synthase
MDARSRRGRKMQIKMDRHTNSPDKNPITVPSRGDLCLAAWLLTATGLAALGHQILWTRRMIDLLGASTESTVRVFVCFFLGLALGSAAASMMVTRISRPWRFLAGVELGVALTCIPIFSLPYWSGWVWPALGPEKLISGLGGVVKTGLSLVLLLPPAFLMGMTLPVIISAVCVTGADVSGKAVRLYAVNTLGGVIGLVVVTAVAIQKLGVPGSMILLIAVNLFVAAKCYRRSLLGEPTHFSKHYQETRDEKSGLLRFRLAVLLALFSGAGVMALEVLTLQMINLSVPMSFYPPAAVLFCVIMLLAVAAALVPRAAQRFGSAERLLPPGLALAAIAVTVVPLIFLSFAMTRTADLVYSPTFGAFLGKTTGMALISLGPAVLFCGLTFPLAMSMCSGVGRIAGRKLGLLLAVNGLGGVVGAEVAKSVLSPTFGVHVALGLVGICYALAALAVGVWTKGRKIVAYALPLVGLVIAVVVTAQKLTALPLFYWGNAYNVIQVRSGREGVLTVFEREGFGRGLSFNNQYLLGGSGSADDAQRQSHIPLLLHPSPERVCYAGLGTGITASGALKHAAVKSVTAVELSPMVVDAAAKHFGEFNDHIDQQTNVVICVEDARTYIAACRGRFDVIIGDLFTPWRPGEAGLASLEYFRASKDALRSGGLFCQWFPMHQLTANEFDAIVSAFRSVFPQAFVFRNHLKTSNLPLALIGFKDSTLDWSTVSRRCSMEREAGRLRDPLCRHPEGLAMLYFGILDGPPPTGPLNTLGNLFVELDAGMNLVVIKPGQHYSYDDDGNPWLSFVKDRMASWPTDASIPEQYRPLLQTGFLVTRLQISSETGDPATALLEQKLRAQFPASVLLDADVDWSLWAGNIKTFSCLRPLTAKPNKQ